ncbi:MAG TPA: hypothetical protein VMU81_09985 [Acetobacteraceae bacterium]|nr:hypothetical protein [Acetobacteraceae bacterium]
MPSDERLLAWIEPRGGDCLASFVAEHAAQRREPATRRFASPDQARQWVMQEAHALDAPVEWIAEGVLRDSTRH